MSRTAADATVRVLEDLLVICADGARGYRHAADAVKEPRLHRVLARSAAQREEIENVLTYALVELGHKPAHHGSLAGTIHRGWLDALGKLSQSPRAVLAECARGEHETIAAFSYALGRSLPDRVHNVVQSQFGRILEANAALRREQSELET